MPNLSAVSSLNGICDIEPGAFAHQASELSGVVRITCSLLKAKQTKSPTGKSVGLSVSPTCCSRIWMHVTTPVKFLWWRCTHWKWPDRQWRFKKSKQGECPTEGGFGKKSISSASSKGHSLGGGIANVVDQIHSRAFGAPPVFANNAQTLELVKNHIITVYDFRMTTLFPSSVPDRPENGTRLERLLIGRDKKNSHGTISLFQAIFSSRPLPADLRAALEASTGTKYDKKPCRPCNGRRAIWLRKIIRMGPNGKHTLFVLHKSCRWNEGCRSSALQ